MTSTDSTEPPIITLEAMVALAEIINQSRAARLPEPAMHPRPGGGAQLEWRTETAVVEIDFPNSGRVVWCRTAPPWSGDAPVERDLTGRSMADVVTLVAEGIGIRLQEDGEGE